MTSRRRDVVGGRRWCAGVALAMLLAADGSRAAAQVLAVPRTCRGVATPATRTIRARTAGRPLAVAGFKPGRDDSLSLVTAWAITNDLTERLSRVPELAVVPPRQNGAPVDDPASEAAFVLESLGARWMLTGTVTRQGTRVEASVTLLRDGRAAWTRSGAGSAVRLPMLVDDIVARTLTTIGIKADAPRSAAIPLRDSLAFDSYLRGTYLVGHPDRQTVYAAITAFETAARLDTAFVPGWVGVTRAYSTVLERGLFSARLDRQTVVQRASDAADRVLVLNPLAASGWLVGGQLLLATNPPSLASAREALARSIRFDPRSAEAQAAFGRAQLYDGDWSGADASLQRSLTIAPMRAGTLVDLAELRSAQRRYGEACSLLNDATVLDPWSPDAYVSRSLIRFRLNDLRSAWADAEVASRLGDRVRGEALGAMIDAASLDVRKATQRLQALPPRSKTPVADARTEEIVLLAAAYVSVRDTATAYRLLTRVGPGSARLAFELQRPEFAPLRGQPHFAELTAGAARARP